MREPKHEQDIVQEAVAKKRISGTLLRLIVYGYLAVILLVWTMIRTTGDRWWFSTLLQYGPRWIYAAPLAILIPLALLFQRRLMLPLSLGGVIALVWLMGLCIPWRTFSGSPGTVLRVLTYNIQQYAVPGESFSLLLEREKIDLIAIQECSGDSQWTEWWKGHDQWHTAHDKGLLIASRFPIKKVECLFSQWPPRRGPLMIAIYCVVETPDGDIGFCNVHLDTPRRALSVLLNDETLLNLNQIDYAQSRLECRENDSDDLAQWLDEFPEPKIVAGDFNMTDDSVIFRKDWEQRCDAFQWAGFGFGYTKQTVIRRREYGSRIDHILCGPDWTPTQCFVGPDLGSDHLPLLAELAANE